MGLSDIFNKHNDAVEKNNAVEKHYNDIILSKDYYLSSHTNFSHPQVPNIMVLGCTGSGKSRLFVKPNILQMNSNYVITDVIPEYVDSTGDFLKNNGYEVKVFNFLNYYQSTSNYYSDKYNPFVYCNTKEDVLVISKIITKRIVSDNDYENSTDPFFEDTIKFFLMSCVGLMLYRRKDGAIPSFYSLVKLIEKVREGRSIKESELAKMFKDAVKDEHLSEDHAWFMKHWSDILDYPDKSLDNAVTSITKFFDSLSDGFMEYTKEDELNLYNIVKKKYSLFMILPYCERVSFLIEILYEQMWKIVYSYGDTADEKFRYLKMKNGETVRVYTAKESEDHGFNEEIESVKNARIEYVSPKSSTEENDFVTGIHKIKDSKGKYITENIRFYNGVYNIVSAKGEYITHKATRKDAEDYIEMLKDAEIERPKSRTPYDIRFILDEFPNMFPILDLKHKLPLLHGYNISFDIICQSIKQLEGDDVKKAMPSDCLFPIKIYMGGDETETCKYFAKMSDNISEKDIPRMSYDEELVWIDGKGSEIIKKYDYPSHKNYKLCWDCVEECEFDNNADREDILKNWRKNRRYF